jgi:hypothetical protein
MSFENLIFEISSPITSPIRRIEENNEKIVYMKYSLFFNETCIKEQLLPTSHRHTACTITVHTQAHLIRPHVQLSAHAYAYTHTASTQATLHACSLCSHDTQDSTHSIRHKHTLYTLYSAHEHALHNAHTAHTYTAPARCGERHGAPHGSAPGAAAGLCHLTGFIRNLISAIVRRIYGFKNCSLHINLHQIAGILAL